MRKKEHLSVMAKGYHLLDHGSEDIRIEGCEQVENGAMAQRSVNDSARTSQVCAEPGWIIENNGSKRRKDCTHAAARLFWPVQLLSIYARNYLLCFFYWLQRVTTSGGLTHDQISKHPRLPPRRA